MTKDDIERWALQAFGSSKNAGFIALKSTVGGTCHVGKFSGNRLNSSTLRSQLLFCTSVVDWNATDQAVKKLFHDDQRIFVQVGEDVWDVYKGVGIDENAQPAFWKQITGLQQFLSDLGNLELGSLKACFSNVDSRQQIRYGAPGTGKSFGLDKETGDDAVVFRTTFHPDSDYSTFVGTYKPTMKGEGTNEKIAYSFRPQTFMSAYVAAWKEYAKGDAGVSLTDRIAKPYAGLNKVMVDVANAFVEEEGKGVVKTRQEIVTKAVELSGGEYMVGSFGPADYCYNRFNVGATFTKPPVFEYLGNSTFKCLGPEDASYSGDIFWRKKSSDVDEVVGHCVNGVRTLNASEPGKKVILVVEEINRGNCAQIFGDLFQLLDREEDGFSTYPIDADADLAKWLSDDDQFGANGLCLEKPTNLKMRDDDWQAVMRGEKLALPPNLYIWATMNTSDQSLFPIDSAFKRRWDWKYVPIAKPDTAGKPDWKDRKIVANGNAYDWWNFITILNGHIADITKSEDKQLGYFFVKAPDATGEITAERFANKVLFYLFNDVFKDWDLPAAIFGKGTSSKEKYAFKDFFYTEKTTVDGKTFMPGDVKEDVVSAFIEKQEDKNHNKVGKASKNPPAPPSAPAPAPAPAPVA